MRVHDRLQTMCDRDDSAIAENSGERVQDQRVSVVIQRRCRFVQNEHPATPNECTGEGDDLALAEGEVASRSADDGVNIDTLFFWEVLLEGEESGRAESIVERRVIFCVEWIEVLADCTGLRGSEEGGGKGLQAASQYGGGKWSLLTNNSGC